jgi:hypothetical protein
MNLKKIIKEEITGLEWVEGDGPFQITTTSGKKYWVIKDTMEVGDEVVYQTDSGLWREYGKINQEKVDDANSFSDYYKVLDPLMYEELDNDWSWTQNEPNIWFSYQMLIFDEVPTKEEIIKFIMDAFKSGLVKKEAIRTWELEGIENEAKEIYEYTQEGVAPYLRIDLNDGWLYYGTYAKDILDKYSELRKINFSEAKNYSINESDFDWINEIEPELTICDAINYLSIGDAIRVLNIEDWKNSNIIHDSLIAEVLEIDNCNNIMEDNRSADPTILIHFKEEYGGFTSSWYNALNSETSKEICSDGRCMFLICGNHGNEQKDVRITPLSKDYINESEEDDWGWAKETNIKVPTNKNELEYFIGWSFLWDQSGKKTGDWGYNGRLWEITGIDNNYVYYYDTKEKITHDTDIRSFLRNLENGSWVLVSPEGYLLDHKYNRTYNKNINESNENDFQWIEDINPKDLTFRIGDVIKVHNVGDEDSFLTWLGDYSDDFLKNRFGEFIIGEIVGLDNRRIEIQERYTDEYIFFPTYSDMENLRTGAGIGFSSYAGLDIYYEPLDIKE